MRATVRKWGNSASVRIPAAVLKAANFDLDMPVDVREENGRIVIEAARASEPLIDDLIDAITPENIHPDIDFGPPAGRERI